MSLFCSVSRLYFSGISDMLLPCLHNRYPPTNLNHPPGQTHTHQIFKATNTRCCDHTLQSDDTSLNGTSARALHILIHIKTWWLIVKQTQSTQTRLSSITHTWFMSTTDTGRRFTFTWHFQGEWRKSHIAFRTDRQKKNSRINSLFLLHYWQMDFQMHTYPLTVPNRIHWNLLQH